MWTHAEVTSLLFGLDAWPRDLEQWHKLLRDFLTLQLICMQPEIHILSDDELYFLLKRSGVDCFQTRGLWSATECLGESLLLSFPGDFTFAKACKTFLYTYTTSIICSIPAKLSFLLILPQLSAVYPQKSFFFPLGISLYLEIWLPRPLPYHV